MGVSMYVSAPNAKAQLRGALACPPCHEAVIAAAFAPKGRYASVPCQLQRLVRQFSYRSAVTGSIILRTSTIFVIGKPLRSECSRSSDSLSAM